ncbi:LytTR family DNA-binding domain-containing protein [Larkinella sp. C7]|uniref:LytTR family DNA-binding domain-containing protein n=1 Tax=Larkinella sp. C7 TaxID=2576607 RepID=UPI0014867A8D|nr:LytTR family DNA-binding domain-containing protein [Larkinella sp. C7]
MRSRDILRMYNQISHITADSNYSRVYLTDGRMFLYGKLLLHWEAELSGFNFFRIHKSHLVNMDHVKLAPVELAQKTIRIPVKGELLPVARRIKPAFLTHFKS